MLLDHVKATFGGAERVFRIPRLPPKESMPTGAEMAAALRSFAAGPSFPVRPRARGPIAAYGALQRLAGDEWTSADVVRVLEAALVPMPGDQDVVREAVEANGPAAYHGLAVLVLSAHLNGIEASEATFDEAEALAA